VPVHVRDSAALFKKSWYTNLNVKRHVGFICSQLDVRR